MKSRSHRLPAYDPPDDWVNGSWTVDCVCGVNFDDGEEMVNCDECGVWVHTRCSRFVKGEKSFACDKCKSKNSRNDSEETEVAQLLVELPTKTMKMSNNSNRCPMNNPPPRRPYRLWTDRPMEDRVHVQGIPGGDPSLFQGMSSIFTAELWKCSGYMPKKFNFQYKEFPCWDKQKKVNDKVAEDSEAMADRGAGVLYSLSNDSLATAPDAALTGVRSQVHAGSSAKKSLKGKRYEGLDVNNKGMQSGVDKERNLIRPIVIHSGKRKRDETGALKERNSKKKNKDYEIKKNKSSPGLKTAFGPPTFGRTTESADKARVKVIKRGQGQEALLTEAASNGYAAGRDSAKLRSSPATKESNLEALSPDMVGHDYMIDKEVNLDKNRNGASGHVTCSHKTDEKLSSVGVQDDDISIPPKKEVMPMDNLENPEQTSPETAAVESLKSKTQIEYVGSAPIEVNKNPIKSENGVICLVHAMRRTVGYAGAISKGVKKSHSPCADVLKMDGTEDLAENLVPSSNHISENGKANNTGVCSSNSADHKLDNDKGHEAASNCYMEKHDDVPGMSSQARQEVLGSECSMETEKLSSESKQLIKGSEETSKLDVTVLSSSASSSQRKLVSLGKSVSSSSNVAISRSSSTDKYKSSSSKQSDPVIKRALSNSIIYTKKDKSRAPIMRSDDKHELLRSTAKECPKLSVNHAPKGPNPTKTPDSSLKHSSGDAKDFVKHTSSKTPPVERSSLPSTVGETSSSSKTQGAPVLQNKNIASPVQSKVEKGSKSNTLSLSKGSHSSLGNAAPSSTPPAGLSDEELALLLHQELNSSLRVPRIPRVRQSGSLPHLSPVAGTSVFAKKSPSSSTKDQHLFSRRKSKDAHKDGARSFREQENKVKKDRVPSSPDSSKTADTSNHAEINSNALDCARKNAPQSSAPAASNVASSSADSPRNNSDDDAGTKGPVHRTLPGLIAEIMSKGERMTYEELCNAVLPHWQNLRKHNGERYAYSSPSQAVLDCLRNRAEWAQLVDRGPKTNASRKRRKLDAEGQNTESEDNEYAEGRIVKRSGSKNLESSREEFPKGKRNARKRRRLALHGRNVKDVRKRRKAKVVSDDDSPSFSNSSEDSAYTEDEDGSQEGDAVGDAGSEDSASSDETGNTL